jgi:hypothetical protein
MRCLLGLILILLPAAGWAADAANPPATKPAGIDIQARKKAHWAWSLVKAPSLPAVHDSTWPQSPIDRFILAKLEERGLKPTPWADKRILIRRAYFDLIGLPPKPEEIAAFLADPSPDAFAKVVDHLLASPHFGERWARHWMDLVRYAESYGHEFDYTIENAWMYRDYLIRAFNSDVPYNRFVAEQIAGDQMSQRLDPDTGCDESLIGPGFWWFGEQTHAPVDVRQHQADVLDNQIDVFGKTFLGLTISCARCHDHKFDAITQKDYAGLVGILESTRLNQAWLEPQGQITWAVARLEKLRGQGSTVMARLVPRSEKSGEEFARYLLAARNVMVDKMSLAEVAARENLDPARLERWIRALNDKAIAAPDHPMFLWPALSGARDDATFSKYRTAAAHRWHKWSDDASHMAGVEYNNFEYWRHTGWTFSQPAPLGHSWDSTLRTPQLVVSGVAQAGMLSTRLPGVLRSPTFTLNKPEILYHLKGRGKVHLVIDGYRMDRFSGLLFSGARFDFDTQGKFVWHRQGKDVSRYVGHQAYIEISCEPGESLVVDDIRFVEKSDALALSSASEIAGRILEDERPASADKLAQAYGSAFCAAVRDRRTESLNWVNWALQHQLLTTDSAAEAQLADIGRQMDAVAGAMPAPRQCLSATDGDGIDEHIFVRGNPKALGQLAPRRFLEAIAGENQPPMPGDHSGRLELACRLVDANTNPFITRVMVNRIWHHLLGRGIVASTDNFGVLGSPPTHPELLDYLADGFVKDGWSIKKTIRKIMLSRVYQMDSKPMDSATEQADPDNSLLHRANIRRLEAEPIRDEILAISGRLDESLYGPPISVFLTPFMEGRGRPKTGPLDGDGRRSIYLGERRNFLSPMMLAFDQPIPFSSMGRRSVSNVPAQALTLMNDPFVLAQAKLWATHLLQQKDLSIAQRIGLMYRTALGRPATAAECNRAIVFLKSQAAEQSIPDEQMASDVSLWTDLAHAIMNVKEFIFIE